METTISTNTRLYNAKHYLCLLNLLFFCKEIHTVPNWKAIQVQMQSIYTQVKVQFTYRVVANTNTKQYRAIQAKYIATQYNHFCIFEKFITLCFIVTWQETPNKKIMQRTHVKE